MTTPRPTLSGALAALALVVAASGTAYAAASVGTSDLKNNAVTSAKIKNKTITSGDLAPATIGSLRKPVAQAHILRDPVGLNPARTRGIKNLSKANTGIYCMELSKPRNLDNTIVHATIEHGNSIGSGYTTAIALYPGICAGDGNFGVLTFDSDGSLTDNASIFVTVY